MKYHHSISYTHHTHGDVDCTYLNSLILDIIDVPLVDILISIYIYICPIIVFSSLFGGENLLMDLDISRPSGLIHTNLAYTD